MQKSRYWNTELAFFACAFLVLTVHHTVDAKNIAVVILPQSKADQSASRPEGGVTGILLTETAQPAATQRVMLIRVRLLDLEGLEIRKLPPQGTVIIDADFMTPAASVRTDTLGRFTFNGVKPGRYSVAVASSKARAGAVLVQRPQETFDTLVFDVAEGQSVDLGNVRAKKE